MTLMTECALRWGTATIHVYRLVSLRYLNMSLRHRKGPEWHIGILEMDLFVHLKTSLRAYIAAQFQSELEASGLFD